MAATSSFAAIRSTLLPTKLISTSHPKLPASRTAFLGNSQYLKSSPAPAIRLAAAGEKGSKRPLCAAPKATSAPSGDVQLLHVYEINERDRESPAYLRFSKKQVENALGDLVPFTNKVS